jgi:hypothetical protein
LVDNIKSEKSIIIENEKGEKLISPESGKNATVSEKSEEKEKKIDDNESSESIHSVIDETTPYEEPAKNFSVFNFIRVLMRFMMQ